MNMEQIYEYLKNCGIFYIATTEEDQPHVRPFGSVSIFEEHLYIVTTNEKKVFHQMLKNPKIEISAMYNNSWSRLEAEVVYDHRRDARQAMWDQNTLDPMYSVDNGKTEVFYLKNATATIYSATATPIVISF